MPSHRDDAVDSMPSPQLDKPNRPYRGCSRCSTISMILAEASFGAVLSAYLSAYQRRRTFDFRPDRRCEPRSSRWCGNQHHVRNGELIQGNCDRGRCMNHRAVDGFRGALDNLPLSGNRRGNLRRGVHVPG